MSIAPALSLVADIGGTNTRVALAQGVTLQDGSVRKYRNAEFDSFPAVLTKYMQDTGCKSPQAACAAMAGPVKDGVGTLTNLAWIVDHTEISHVTGAAEVGVLNDMQAQGHALAHLGDGSVTCLRKGARSDERATRMIMGVGTGFNSALVYRGHDETVVPPSESGHFVLPVRSSEGLALCDWLETKHGYPAVEEVMSGRGLSNCYAWHVDQAGLDQKKTSDAIMAAVQDGSDPIATAALGTFVRTMGEVAGTLALIQLPFGGIYLIGGMSRAVAPYLADHGFYDALRDKGRFSAFTDQFGVYLVEDDYAALIGCASHMSEILARG